MLKDKLAQRAGLLSAGERQALALGMVLIRPAELLLLDEPTGGLSPKRAARTLGAVREAQAVRHFATIIIEHNLRSVHEMVSRVLVIQQGRIVAREGNPSALVDYKNLQRYYFE